MYRFQPGESPDFVGEEITAFHPFVPGVHHDKARLGGGVCVGIVLSKAEILLKHLWSMVLLRHFVGAHPGEAGRVVPAHGDGVEDGDVQHVGGPFADIHRVGAVLSIIGVESSHVVAGYAVDSQVLDIFLNDSGVRFDQIIAVTLAYA